MAFTALAKDQLQRPSSGRWRLSIVRFRIYHRFRPVADDIIPSGIGGKRHFLASVAPPGRRHQDCCLGRPFTPGSRQSAGKPDAPHASRTPGPGRNRARQRLECAQLAAAFPRGSTSAQPCARQTPAGRTRCQLQSDGGSQALRASPAAAGLVRLLLCQMTLISVSIVHPFARTDLATVNPAEPSILLPKPVRVEAPEIGRGLLSQIVQPIGQRASQTALTVLSAPNQWIPARAAPGLAKVANVQDRVVEQVAIRFPFRLGKRFQFMWPS